MWAAGTPVREPLGWRMDGTGEFPRAQPPLRWSVTENVLWTAAMPKWSNASPIVVGDRIFVTAEPDLLLCIAAADGRILWQRKVSLDDVSTAVIRLQPDDQQETRLRQAQQALAAAEYSLTVLRRKARGAQASGTPSAESAALVKQAEALRHELAGLARGSTPPAVHEANGFSTPTPASDGTSVYVLFGTGVVASYDVDGNRRWIRFVDRALVPNGAASSPLLAGGKLVVLLNDLVALDPATGAVEWRVESPARPGSPVAFDVEGQAVVITPSGQCVRVADGAVLASGLGDLEYDSPLVRDGVLYMIQATARAFRIPKKMSDSLKFESLWTAKLERERYYGSPVFVDGLLYAITRTQIVSVLDATTGEVVYTQRLALNAVTEVDGVYSSLTRGGSHVFASGFQGTTAVLKPGRSFEQVGLNPLEPFRSNPVFLGDRVYVRAKDKLYCLSSALGGKGGTEAASR